MWLVRPVNRRVELRRKILSMVRHSLQIKKGYNDWIKVDKMVK